MADEIDEQAILTSHADNIGRLFDRLSRAITKQRSINLSAFEADLLCVTGAHEAIMMAMLREEKRRAFQRLQDKPRADGS